MKQTEKNNKINGEKAFDEYYSALFLERWTDLKKALQAPVVHTQYNAGGRDCYFLDSASIRAAATLPLRGAKSILDMCAAPGGKTLVLASCMDEDAVLLSNERSNDRKIRLIHTVQNCLPENIQNRITVIGKDGSTLCRFSDNKFDRILLDAPCSSERHVLTDYNYLKDWSLSRIKTLSIAQWALLSSAWRMLNEDGFLVYSTCALNPEENDGVIKRLIKKFDDVEICDPEINNDVSPFCKTDFAVGEKTEYGIHVLPDKCNGNGPLFFSLFHKKKS